MVVDPFGKEGSFSLVPGTNFVRSAAELSSTHSLSWKGSTPRRLESAWPWEKGPRPRAPLQQTAACPAPVLRQSRRLLGCGPGCALPAPGFVPVAKARMTRKVRLSTVSALDQHVVALRLAPP